MKTLLLIVMFLSLLIAAWRLVRGWRSPVDPFIVGMSLALFGVAGALIDDDWIQALGQGTSLGLAGTTALWAGKSRDPQVQRMAVVTTIQRRLLWYGLNPSNRCGGRWPRRFRVVGFRSRKRT